MNLLEVKSLTVTDLRKKEVIVKNLCFTLERNSCLGIVGESGCGKSMASKAIMGLINPSLQVTGTVQFEDMDLIQMKSKQMRKIRGRRICMILQDAMTAFDPLSTIGSQMNETIREKLEVSKKEAENISMIELQRMNIHEPLHVLKKYPHQLSGGMLQRCMIAIAVAMKPDIIIADEPTTALDSINQNEVVNAFQKLRNESGTAVIFISHDLGVVQRLAQTVLVMKDGKQVEYGKAEDVFSQPQHEYTQHLVNTRVQLTKSFTEVMGKDKVLCLK